MGLTQGCQEKSGQDKATAVRFDAGVGLFHFLALCVTLMNKFGSLSQEHDRIGVRKSTEDKCSAVWGKVQIIGSARVRANQISPECLAWAGAVRGPRCPV